MNGPSRQALRYFSTTCCRLKKPNIQKPRVPGTERRILDAVTVPVFPKDLRPLPQQCYDSMQEKIAAQKSELAEAYLAFRLKQATKMLEENKMVAICHLLPMTSRDFFQMKTKFFTAGMNLVFARNDIMKEAIANTRLQNLEPYLTSDNVYIVSEESMVAELVSIVRKVPEIQLLGGLVENRILSRDVLYDIAKLPPLDVMRGELLTILSASASKTSRLLGRHQQELTTNLDQLLKQGQETKAEKSATEGENNLSRESSPKVEEPQT